MFSDSSSGDDDVFLSPASELGTLKLDRQLSSDMPMTDEDPTRVRTCSLLNIVATISFHAFTAHPVGHWGIVFLRVSLSVYAYIHVYGRAIRGVFQPACH